jgi:hypothetical protein
MTATDHGGARFITWSLKYVFTWEMSLGNTQVLPTLIHITSVGIIMEPRFVDIIAAASRSRLKAATSGCRDRTMRRLVHRRQTSCRYRAFLS